MVADHIIQLFQVLLIGIGLFPSINKGIQILFGCPQIRKLHGRTGPSIPRIECTTKQDTVENLTTPVKAGDKTVVQLNNSPKSKNIPPNHLSQTLNGFTCAYYDSGVTNIKKSPKQAEFIGNSAGGRKRTVHPQYKLDLDMNSWRSSSKVQATRITYYKYRMSHERHSSRKHGSARENKPTITTSLIIKKSNRVVFKGSQKTFKKKVRF